MPRGVNSIEDPSDKTTVDTNFEFYLITKSVTTTAVLQLLEQGNIKSVDEPAETYVPELAQVKVIEGFDENDKPVLVEPKTKVTIRHLLTHTSGFGYPFGSEYYAKLQKLASGDDFNIMKCKALNFDFPLLFHPVGRWQYGIGIDWAGKIVQNVSRLTLDQYFQKNIFEPLGAKGVSFIKTKDHPKNFAKLHVRSPQYAPLRLAPELELPPDPEFQPGGMGLRGAVPEFLKFLEIFLHDGKSPRTGAQILKPETVHNYSLQNLFPGGKPVPSGTAVETQPHLTIIDPITVLPYFPSYTASFAQLPVALPTGRSANSFFWGGMSNSLYWIDIEKGIIGFCATLVLPFSDKFGKLYNEEIEIGVYKALAEAENV